MAQKVLGRVRGEREHPGGRRVGMDGRREVLSVAEGMKEDSESWREFIKGMLARGLKA